MQNMHPYNANGDLARHQHEKHSVRTVVPLGSGSSLSRETESPVSLLEEERFFSRLLSRESAKGFSSRAYYRAAGKVPFEWEIEPGMPKKPLENDDLPPISPPPSVHHHLLSQNLRRDKSRSWLLRVVGIVRKKVAGISRRCDEGTAAGLGHREGVPATADCSPWNFPEPKKGRRWAASGTVGCFPYGLIRLFGSDSGRSLEAKA